MALPAAPLDFSLSQVRATGIQQTSPVQHQQTTQIQNQPLQHQTNLLATLKASPRDDGHSPSGQRQSAGSAFRIVMPKGKFDGELIDIVIIVDGVKILMMLICA